MTNMNHVPLSEAGLAALRRWNTPTIYNGWEQITRSDASKDGFNVEGCRDFMPEMDAMIGYAVTVVIEPSNAEHPAKNAHAWSEYRRYVASVPGPKVVIVQDLDKPRTVGSFWGEVNSNIHRTLGCVGTITDGGIRDLDEMRGVGFKAIARRLCVGHAHAHPVRWNGEVEVFGRTVRPGQLIHADKHGFLVIPREDQGRLLEAAEYMDANERKTVIAAAKETRGKPIKEALAAIDKACEEFSKNTRAEFAQEGEW